MEKTQQQEELEQQPQQPKKGIKRGILKKLLVLVVLLMSVFCMFLLDETNVVRDKYMSFLSSNFIVWMLDLMNVQRYNIGVGPWLIFLALVAIVVFLLIASMFSKAFVKGMVEKNIDKFESERAAEKRYKTLYFLVATLIAVAFAFIFVMTGGINAFKNITYAIYLDLIYTLLICMLFMLLGITVISVIVLILREVIGGGSGEGSGHGGSGNGNGNGGGGNGGVTKFDGGNFTTKIEESDTLDKDLFPALTAMDLEHAEKGIETTETEDITLEEFTLRFQSFCCNHCKVYYELPVIRAFVAGLAASRLLILQGLSGTGKSLMPRMFSRFTGSKVFFSPVQSTWRDKTDVLGFYSEFTKTFKITDFLSDLYSASYTDKTAMIVLDEMNLSRIEYYFADFLSILEYPKEEWKIKVYDPELGQRLPDKLTDGYVQIPPNTWFIGTANTDDSTFTITDKVYDRAITLEFRERVNKITSDYMSDPLPISSEKLQAMFAEAKANEEYCLSDLDTDKFLNICDFIRDAFDIRFGNRIMVQINQFVPVYVALGGTKEAALDFMLASKVLRKLEGMFEDYVKDELLKLTKLLNSTYGKGVMVETERVIAKILRRLV